MKLRNFLDFAKNEARNMVLHILASAPASPAAGQVYYNSTSNHPEYHNGTTFKDLTDAEKLGGQDSTFHIARANHTGTQAASTISDFDTQVRTSRLDQMAAPTAIVSLNSQKISNLASGTNPNDAVNFTQLEQARQGVRAKAPVEVAASGNVTIANPGTDTFQGVVLVNGEAILLPNQTTATEKGIYVFNGSVVAMTRRDDADAFVEIDGGTEVFVQGGDNAYAGKLVRQLAELTSFAGQDWQVIGAGTTYSAGDGLTEAPAGQFNVGAGTGITSNTNDVAITTTLVPRMYSGLIGDNAATSITIAAATHGLGTGRKKIVQVFEESTGDEVIPDVNLEADGDVVIAFAIAPTTNQYRVNILGII
jgi:hypothetical protein